MSQSFAIQCPHCRAGGELSDPQLLGQPIVCPACQMVFVAPLPSPAAPPSVPLPVLSIVEPAVTAPSNPSFVPQAIPPSPAALAGPAEELFASSLPQPTARGSIKPPKPQSKLLMTVAWSSVSAIVLFATYMFLAGDPWRGADAKISARNAAISREKEREQKIRAAETRAAERALAASRTRIPETASSELDSSLEGMTLPNPQLASKPSETAVMASKDAAPSDSSITVIEGYVPPPLEGDDGSETEENIPREIKAKLDAAYGDEYTPLIVEFLSHPHAGVRRRAAQMLQYRNPVPEAAAPLRKLMQDLDSQVRIAAANSLSKHGTDSTDLIPLLGAVLLKDPVRDVRSASASTLRTLATEDAQRAPAVAAVLIAALHNAREEDLDYLGPAFGPLGEAAQPVIPQFVRLLKNNRCRDHVAGSLAELGQIEPLVAILANPDPHGNSVKYVIADGIGRQRGMTPAMLDLLKSIYESGDVFVKQHAIQALQSCEPKLAEAIPMLEQAQSDTNELVRAAAVTAIAQYDVNPGVKMRGYLKTLSDSKPELSWVRGTIIQAITSLKFDGLRSLVQILTDPETPAEIRSAAASVLATSYWQIDERDEEFIDQVKSLVQDPKQPLDARAGCSVLLMSLHVRLAQIEPTLKEAVAADHLDHTIRVSAAERIDRSNPTTIRYFIEVARRFQEPLPDDASKNEKSGRTEIHKSILQILAQMAAASGKQDRPDVLPFFLTAINEGEPEIKETALAQIGMVARKSTEAAEAARLLLSHDSIEVRNQALRALGVLHEVAGSAIPQIHAALKDDNQIVRWNAAQALGEFGSAAAEAIPDLLDAMGVDPNLRNSAAPLALAKIAPQDEAVLAALIRELDKADSAGDILAALVQLGPRAREAVPKLRTLFGVSNKYQRQTIMRILSQLGADGKPALPEMILELEDQDPWTRSAAVTAISELKEHAADAVPKIVDLLTDNSPEVQSSAVMALQRIGPSAASAVPQLEIIASTTNLPHLKFQINAAIDRITAKPGDVDASLFRLLAETENLQEIQKAMPADPATVLPSLARLSGGKDEIVRQRAWMILNQLMTHPAAKQELQKMLAGDDLPGRALAAVLLQRLPSGGDRDELALQLAPWLQNESTSRTAVELISRLGPAGLKILAETLTNESIPSNRRRELVDAVTYLLSGRRTMLIPLLREAMKSDSKEKQQAAVLVLGRMNPLETEILPAILAALSDEAPDVCSQAATVLEAMANHEIDVKAAIPGLMKNISVTPEELKKRSVEQQTLFHNATAAMVAIKAQPEQLPQLRQILRDATNGANGPDADGFVEYGIYAIRILATLGPQAAEALPEIKVFLERVGDRGFSTDLMQIGEASRPMVVELARESTLRPEIRKSAVQLIGELQEDDQLVEPALMELIKDRDVGVRVAAAAVLSRVPSHLDDALNVLRDVVRTRDKAESPFAVQLLRQLGRKSAPAIPDLVAVADQIEPWRVGEFISTLIEIAPNDPDVQKALTELLKSPSWAFTDLQSKNAFLITSLIEVLQDENSSFHLKAAELLGGFEDKAIEAVPFLRKLMTTNEDDGGLTAAIALARIDPTAQDTVPRLLEGLDNLQLRWQCSKAFQRLGPTAADGVPRLIEMIASGKQEDCVAFEIIGKMGPAAKPALPVLVEALTDPLRHEMALMALENLEDNAADVGPELLDLMQRRQSAYSVATVLARLGKPAEDAVDLLRGELQDPETRLEAVELLQRFGDVAKSAVPQLLQFAKGNDRDLRIAAMKTLASIEVAAGESVPLLAAALTDSDPGIAMAACIALSQQSKHAGSVLPQIVMALQKNRHCTQWNLIDLLGQMGPLAKDAVPAINKLSQSSDLNVRRMARAALKKIQSAEPAQSN